MFIFTKRDKDDKEPKEREFVSCDGCGCLIEKISTQKVLYPIATFFYCGKCRESYDRVIPPGYCGNNTDENRYFSSKEREVTRDGKLINTR